MLLYIKFLYIIDKNGEDMGISNYIYDDVVSLRVDVDYEISNTFKVHDYMYGRCHLFALIASEIIQAPLQAYVAPHQEFGFCLSHVFCRINTNTVLDASGLWNLYSVKSKYDEPGIYLFDNGFELKKSLMEMIRKEELCDFDINEEINIINYLKEMKNNGCLELLINENKPMVDIETILTSVGKSLEKKKNNNRVILK